MRSIDYRVLQLKKADLFETKAGELVLTDSGSVRHQECLEKQQAFKGQVMSEISKQEYDGAILTLQKMIGNIHVL